MPKALENKLKKEASKKFPGDKERRNKYVFGTLNRLAEEGKIPASYKSGKK